MSLLSLIESLASKICNIEEQIKVKSESVGNIVKSIDKLANDRVEHSSYLNVLSGALQAYNDALAAVRQSHALSESSEVTVNPEEVSE